MHCGSLPLQLLRGAAHFRRHADDLHDLRLRAQAVTELLGYTIEPASPTPINGEIGLHRRVDWLTQTPADNGTGRGTRPRGYNRLVWCLASALKD